MAIDDIGPDDGPTTVVPGSHKSNLPHPEIAPGDYHRGEPLDGLAGIESVTMRAGDALLFTDAVMHGGATRTAPGERRTVLYLYGVS